MKKKRYTPIGVVYSGIASHEFWKRINSLEDECEQSALYAMGVMLQNQEGFVVKQLNNAMHAQRQRKKLWGNRPAKPKGTPCSEQ